MNIPDKENFLQLVLDNIPSYVFWKDRNSVYLGCNMNFAKSAGLSSPDEIIGKTDYDLPWSKEESDFFRKIDKNVMKSGQSQINFEESQTVNDGSTRWLRTSKIPLFDSEKNIIGILGTYEDITPKKLAELALMQSNENLKKLNSKLEIINVDLEQFAYAMSHDIQEPLRMIGGFAGLIEKRYSDVLDKEATEYLEFIKEGILRMSTLTKQILSYSKLEKVEQGCMDTDFSLLIEDILKDLTSLIKNKNVKLEIVLPKQKIRCQPYRIKILFYNLITNAIKFNKSESPIIKISYKNHPNKWYFEVSDNGIGIESEYQELIFKPFKRLNTRDKFSGNGIGLSICKRITYLHGGQIWFTNNELGGTTFHFTISKKLVLID